jgi:branched-chain amino acid transport system permease protein
MSLYMVYYLEFVAAFILLTWALYIPFRAGQLYNGPVYCMAIGGYFAAFAAREWGWPFILVVFGAILLGTLFGFIPALGFARTTGIATAMASIALIFIIQSVLRNVEFLGGPRGLWNIPKVEHLLPASWAIVFIVGIFVYRLDHSRIGKALEAMLVDPDLAATMGVNTIWIRVLALTISSAIGSLAGVIFAFTLRTIYPETFGFSLLLYVWTILYVGGRYTMWGALIATPILWGLPQWVPNQVAEYTNILYGALLVVILLLRPQGLINRELLLRIRSFFISKHSRRIGT